MSKEIERKFIVANPDLIPPSSKSHHIRQAYISSNPDATVRIRVCDEKAFITVKGRNTGAVRDEWEYPVPLTDAIEMATKLCGGFAIDKTRHIVCHEGWKWEIDIFHGRHKGLMLAEIEIPDIESNPPLPPFVGLEVTDDPRYYNSTLSISTDVIDKQQMQNR